MKTLFLILCVFLHAPQTEMTTERFTEMLENSLRNRGQLGPNQHLTAHAIRKFEDLAIAELVKQGAQFKQF